MSRLCQALVRICGVQRRIMQHMTELSPTASRTQRSILTAAISLLATRPEAPMTDVAEAAGVSRSTLHRYFPDRATLRTAIDELAHSAWIDAVASARLEQGTGLEAFRRLCAELMDRLDVLAWWMVSPEMSEGADQEEVDPADVEIHDALTRGHQDGTIDPAMRADWMQSMMWAVLYAVQMNPAVMGLTVFDAREQGMRTLMKAAAADPDRA